MKKVKDVLGSFKVIKKWDWGYAIQELLAGIALLGIEAWFCWMIVSSL